MKRHHWLMIGVFVVGVALGCDKRTRPTKPADGATLQPASRFTPPAYWRVDDLATHINQGGKIQAQIVPNHPVMGQVRLNIGIDDRWVLLKVATHGSAVEASRVAREESGNVHPEVVAWGHFTLAAERELHAPTLHAVHDHLRTAPATTGNQR